MANRLDKNAAEEEIIHYIFIPKTYLLKDFLNRHIINNKISIFVLEKTRVKMDEKICIKRKIQRIHFLIYFKLLSLFSDPVTVINNYYGPRY